MPGAITDVAGILVGHATDRRRPTGCTVVLAEGGATAGVDVRGAAPGTRETTLLDPAHLVDRVDAVLLTGGSAFGLAAADGVMRWLVERGRGFPAGGVRVPIVPAAVLFDLGMGDPAIFPDAAAGHAACAAASAAPPEEGSVGAGAGATVGKLFGLSRAMKGGIGTAAIRVDGVTVGALVAVNAVGDVLGPDGRVLAGARAAPDGLQPVDAVAALLAGARPEVPPAANTTIGVVATDARLDKAQCTHLARVAQDGIARAIRPAHSLWDGDTLFALSTARAEGGPDLMRLGIMAAAAVEEAIRRAVLAAQPVAGPGVPVLPTASLLRAGPGSWCPK
ncbi:MAG: P1 family peptidase [Rhodovarius sp.]|nr:P1 family peptidase [Rhodovarius sp.]